MNEQRHTPGPWVVESDGSTVTMGGQCVIVGPAPDGAPREVEKANARLIAFAPDLLDALKSQAIATAKADGWDANAASVKWEEYLCDEAREVFIGLEMKNGGE